MTIYLIGKYSAPTRDEEEINVEIHNEYAKQILLTGHVPVSPVRISGLWNYDERFAGWKHDDWIERFCFPLLDACNAIFLIPGWQSSEGSIMEWQRALKQGKKVYKGILGLRSATIQAERRKEVNECSTDR